ncbi:hypothetical protein C1H76_2910 [Elsinoe australis]|uniref:ASST-domain-containing protein n=1 Tax=Elsinoe australis TaxID=40998 RepID=A0A4U7B4U1_9PEZI|nr:hypothetical protein C1H76_2910 [Elsinoe australis]
MQLSGLFWISIVAVQCVPEVVGQSNVDLGEAHCASTYRYSSYHSTDITFPVVERTINSSACRNGLYTFITPRGSAVPKPAVAIFDDDDQPVWTKPTEGQAYDFKVQEVNGQQYLSYWTGDDKIRGHGSGEWVVLNSSYEEQGRVKALNGLTADLHELVITPDRTALITVYEARQVDRTDLNDLNSTLNNMYMWDCLFQEIDIANNELIFEWRASDHYSINDTFHEPGDTGSADNPFDWFHINSVQKDKLGNYIVSARYTHSVTYIDGNTGSVLWILGGKRNNFQDLSDGNATDFAWQHDARLHDLEAFPQTMLSSISAHNLPLNGRRTQLLTLFDNAAEDILHSRPYSRGLLLELTYPSHPETLLLTQERASPSQSSPYTACLIHPYVHPAHISSSSQGSLQLLPSQTLGEDPRLLIGYGFNAVWTTFDPNGTAVCDVRFAPSASWETGDVQSYRVFQSRWVGRPRTVPQVAMAGGYDEDKVYVSWNGATEVTGWRVQSAMHSRAKRWGRREWFDVVSVEKKGFETGIALEGRMVFRWVRVVALDGDRVELGASEPLDLGRERAKRLFGDFVRAALRTRKLMVLSHVVVPMFALVVVFAGGIVWCARVCARGQGVGGPILRSY